LNPWQRVSRYSTKVGTGKGERVLVIGDGKLGILAAQVLRTTGCELLLAGRHDEKLEMVNREFGMDTVLSEKFDDGANDAAFDMVVECSGNPSGLELATRMCRPRGTIVLKSTYAGEPCMDMAPWVINEITVAGSRCGPFEPAIRALDEGDVDPLPLVDATFPIERALEAFEAAVRPGAGKILIEIAS